MCAAPPRLNVYFHVSVTVNTKFAYHDIQGYPVLGLDSVHCIMGQYYISSIARQAPYVGTYLNFATLPVERSWAEAMYSRSDQRAK